MKDFTFQGNVMPSKKLRDHPTKKNKPFVRNVARSPQEWEQQLAELYSALREPDSPFQRLHIETEQVLPLYLAQERRGENAAQNFPLIHQHLQACSQCNILYQRLKTALAAANPQPRAANARQNREIESLPRKASALQIIQSPATPRAPAQVRFVLSPSALLSRSQPSFVARGAMPLSERLLFSAQVTFDKHPLLVQAWFAPARKKNCVNVRLELAVATTIARRARAILDWGEHHLESKFTRGSSTFPNLAVVPADSPISLTLQFSPHVRTRSHPRPRSTNRVSKRATKTRARQV